MSYKLPVIETERLILREICYRDAENMFEYAKLPNVGPSAGWEPHRTIDDTKAIIEVFLNKKKYGQLGVFAIILKSEKKMIGTVELHSYVPGFKAELGYTISPYYWGNGYAYEASVALLNWAFEKLGLKRIECTTFVSNSQSKRVCEKLKLRFEGVRMKGYMLYDGSIHDVFAYAITNEEYFQLYKGNPFKIKYLQ